MFYDKIGGGESGRRDWRTKGGGGMSVVTYAYHKREIMCFLQLLVACTDGGRGKQQEVMCIVQRMLVQRERKKGEKAVARWEGGGERLIREDSKGDRQTDRMEGDRERTMTNCR
jgi:hypothetical protein